MSYEHKPGSFSLFPNDKGGNDKRPDWRGEGKDMAGNRIEVAAWTRQSSKGEWLSCTFKLKDAKPIEPRTETAPVQQRPVTGTIADMSDDVPFAPIGRGIGGHCV